MPKLGIKMREFDTFKKHEIDAKLASSIILSLLTRDTQTIDLSYIINQLHNIFQGHAHWSDIK